MAYVARNIITNELDKCVGCNRCLRVCPIDEANVTSERDGKIKVEVDGEKCISCGACLVACHHGSRHYEDDTERFFADLKNGVPISVMTAPAVKTNFDEWGRLLAWLRKEGVGRIYDVSLGADICVWAHIRYMQKYGTRPLITQPCPSIVRYILRHRNELVRYLSPVYSPMLCTATYMRKYEGVGTKIAAISPCIAKTIEFEATRAVDYNITISKLCKYIEDNRVVFPVEPSGFDSYDSGLGSLFPMPGGLKENIENYLGKSVRIDKSEGPQSVYKALDEYAGQREQALPALFDVLNCKEGCNAGTGTLKGSSVFEINAKMDSTRQAALGEDRKQYLDDLYLRFDESLELSDFLSAYAPAVVQPIRVGQEDMDAAFASLYKFDEASMTFDCGACGCDSCLEMARKIAKGVNTPNNCVEKARSDIQREQAENSALQKTNLYNIDSILADTGNIKEMTETIVSNIDNITEAISVYNSMIRDIEKIAMQVNIIALNASIEAARAGSHGKAFNVVAEEIRTLAQSSSRSAQQTNESSVKATEAISAVNDMVMKISENVNASYENIVAISENTKKILKEG
ncbi:MAG: methyl-accepting chemotaxis protein [Clostridiales bacterium]|nr:methyl-accepting chemotaxis protein [Clostridiales bacterium]